MFSSNYHIQRQASETINQLSEVYCDKDITEIARKLIDSDILLEKILISSKSLFNQIKRVKRNETVLTEAVALAVIKYYVRTASRPMPFGLMAGITLENNQGEGSVAKKEVRISNEWLYKFVKLLEQYQDERSELLLSVNPTLLVERHQYTLEIGINKYEKVLLKDSDFLKLVFSILSKTRSLTSTLELLSKNGYKTNGTLKTIKKLLEMDFIVSELRPSTVKTHTHIFHIIKKKGIRITDELRANMLKIESMIEDYKCTKIGEGANQYLEILSFMRDICESKNYLAVDLIYNKKNEQPLMEEEIENLVENTKFLSVFKDIFFDTKVWDQYCDSFTERYGLFNEVPLLELIEFPHLGFPKNKGSEYLPSESEIRYSMFIIPLVTSAIAEKKNVIQLSKDTIHKISEIFGKKRRPILSEGYDLKYSVFEEEGIKKILLRKNSFSTTCRSYSGRFYRGNCNRDSILKTESEIYKNDEYISAEINYHPNNYCDIGIANKIAKFKININSITEDHDENSVILPKDIVVGMDINGLYLRSKILNKKILPVTSHMLHYSNFLENKAMLFLFNYYKYVTNTPGEFEIRIMDKAPFIPRFEYNNIVISPMRWRMSLEKHTSEFNKKSHSQIKEYIKKFLLDYNVNTYVAIVNQDMFMVVNPYTNVGLEIIKDELIRLKELDLTEAPEVTNKNDGYVKDYIVTVNPDSSADKIKGTALQESKINSIAYRGEVNSEWSSYHIYLKDDGYDKILTIIINQIFNNIPNLFFINYYPGFRK